jgi:hypothetical protein
MCFQCNVVAAIVETISHYYQNYAKLMQCKFVVFYEEEPIALETFDSVISTKLYFNKSRSKSLLTPETSPIVRFVAVSLTQVYSSRSVSNNGGAAVVSNRRFELGSVPAQMDEKCLFFSSVKASVGMVRLSAFFIKRAFQLLKSYGYEWFWRFSTHSRFEKPVRYSVIEKMKQEKAKFAFDLQPVPGSSCLTGLWSTARAICSRRGLFDCPGFINKWPEGYTILTDAAISHSSIWDSDIYRELLLALWSQQQLYGKPFYASNSSLLSPDKSTSSAPPQPNSRQLRSSDGRRSRAGHAKERDLLWWKDSWVHTAGVLLVLAPSEVSKLNGIFRRSINAAQYHSLNVLTDNSTNALDSDIVPIRIPELDTWFNPRRFGWLGGDVAASFYLPPKGDQRTPFKEYIWLFGDSLIGTSSANRFNFLKAFLCFRFIIIFFI